MTQNVLAHLLEPIVSLISASDIRDVCVDAPGVAFLCGPTGWHRRDIPELSEAWLRCLRLALLSGDCGAGEQAPPFISADVPFGRLQLVCFPACASQEIHLAVRVSGTGRFRLEDFGLASPRATPHWSAGERASGASRVRCGELDHLLIEAMRARANLAIVGVTGSGKTSLISALLELAAPDERVILIEDTPEIRAVRPNWVALRYSENGRVSAADCVRAALRLRPDRIVITELRGKEAFDLLCATSTGHRGVLTSFHATGLLDASDRFCLMAAAHPSASRYSPEHLSNLALSAFDLVVTMDRNGARPGIVDCGAWPAQSSQFSAFD